MYNYVLFKKIDFPFPTSQRRIVITHYVNYTLSRHESVVRPMVYRIERSHVRSVLKSAGVLLASVAFNVAITTPTSAVRQGRCIVMDVYPSRPLRRLAGSAMFAVEYAFPLFGRSSLWSLNVMGSLVRKEFAEGFIRSSIIYYEFYILGILSNKTNIY